MSQLSLHTPVGDLTVSEDDGAIVSVDWGWSAWQNETPLLCAARRQLHHYFDGELERFDLPLRPHGTLFQSRVWTLMSQISYGKTMTYGEIAKALGSAPRAIGGACGANPIPVLIPCHRVLASDGGLGGYSGDGGTETKLFLLRLERARL